jgi:hypothetical protein
VPGVIGEHDEEAAEAELARAAGKHTRIDGLSVAAQPPGPGLGMGNADGDHHTAPPQ